MKLITFSLLACALSVPMVTQHTTNVLHQLHLRVTFTTLALGQEMARLDDATASEEETVPIK
jgi:hypothetical protein